MISSVQVKRFFKDNLKKTYFLELLGVQKNVENSSSFPIKYIHESQNVEKNRVI